MKKILALVLAVMMTLGLVSGALAVNEDVEGELVIYSSMYPFVIDMMDEALKAEFPNLVPGNDGSFFFYGGTSSLITKIYGEMETGTLGCDMMLVAEPAFSLELKDAGYLQPIEIDNPGELLRFPYDEEGYWYPVRVCNMVLAYNPEKEAEWNAKGVNIPKTRHRSRPQGLHLHGQPPDQRHHLRRRGLPDPGRPLRQGLPQGPGRQRSDDRVRLHRAGKTQDR